MTTAFWSFFYIFGLVFFVLKSLLGIARQLSLEKFAILTLKPRIHVRILIYPMWAISPPAVPFASSDSRMTVNPVKSGHNFTVVCTIERYLKTSQPLLNSFYERRTVLHG